MGKLTIDMTGKKVGRLLVIERAPNKIYANGVSVVAWKCLCDCGKEIITTGTRLRNGEALSCGCYNREVSSLRREYNEYDLSGEYGIGYTKKGEKFLFDLEDYEKIKDYYWMLEKDGYARTVVYKDGGKKSILMHRLIMDAKHGEKVDHIKHNNTDNRKSQLRIVNNSQNAMNSNLEIKTASGVRGVSYNTKKKKWVPTLKLNGKSLYLGVFNEMEDAIKARKEAEEKYFGEYSYENSMKIDNAIQNKKEEIKNE